MMGPDVTFPWNYYMPSHQWWRREAALLSIGTSGCIQSASSSSTTRDSNATTATTTTSSSFSPGKKSPEDKNFNVTEKGSKNSCDVGAGAALIPHYFPPFYQQRGNFVHGGIPRSFTLLEPSSYNCSEEAGVNSNVVGKSTSVNFKETQQQQQDSLVPSYSEALLLGDQNDDQCQGTNLNASDDESTPLVCDLPESPPDYIQALRTSRPVFLPPIFRLRRCQTEKRVHRSKQYYQDGRNARGRLRWLDDVQPTFLQSHQPSSSSSSQVNNDREEED